MVNLNEKLSEFSYGYAVTKETEKLLNSIGHATCPYLPNLKDENKVGYDVKFNKPGKILLLQFKLGQILKRLHYKNINKKPEINRPFFRFKIETNEPNGQFETLCAAEHSGAEVFYVAPAFYKWTEFSNFFLNGSVLDNSKLISPTEINNALIKSKQNSNTHRILYDTIGNCHVCSEPIKIETARASDIKLKIDRDKKTRKTTIGDDIENIYYKSQDKNNIRRYTKEYYNEYDSKEKSEKNIESLKKKAEISDRNYAEKRRKIFDFAESQSKSRQEALATALAIEFMGLGIQMIFAMEE